MSHTKSSSRNIVKTSYYYFKSYTEYRTFKCLDVYVTSHGGVGTSFIGDYISKFQKTNDPFDMTYDFTKHLPHPPIRTPKNLKVIYIFGDPCLATISLFRRKFAFLQTCKNGSFHQISRDETIYDYIQIGKDKLGLTKHLKSWLRYKNRRNSYLFINYDALWNNKMIISDFLEMPKSFIESFPVRKSRESLDILETLDSKLYQRLKSIYLDYYKIMEEIGDINISKAAIK